MCELPVRSGGTALPSAAHPREGCSGSPEPAKLSASSRFPSQKTHGCPLQAGRPPAGQRGFAPRSPGGAIIHASPLGTPERRRAEKAFKAPRRSVFLKRPPFRNTGSRNSGHVRGAEPGRPAGSGAVRGAGNPAYLWRRTTCWLEGEHRAAETCGSRARPAAKGEAPTPAPREAASRPRAARREPAAPSNLNFIEGRGGPAERRLSPPLPLTLPRAGPPASAGLPLGLLPAPGRPGRPAMPPPPPPVTRAAFGPRGGPAPPSRRASGPRPRRTHLGVPARRGAGPGGRGRGRSGGACAREWGGARGLHARALRRRVAVRGRVGAGNPPVGRLT